jgi:formyl-CoA transferase
LITEYDKNGFIRERTGAILPNIAPSNVYPTLDSIVLIGANQDTVFRRLCIAMGRGELASDPDYATHQSRGRNQRQLDDLIAAWSAERSTAQVLSLMEEHGVPAGLIYRAPDMLSDPQFAARAAIVTVSHPVYGDLKMQNVAPKLSATPGKIRSIAPCLGEHNDQVYLELLGMPAPRYDALKRTRVI